MSSNKANENPFAKGAYNPLANSETPIWLQKENQNKSEINPFMVEEQQHDPPHLIPPPPISEET